MYLLLLRFYSNNRIHILNSIAFLLDFINTDLTQINTPIQWGKHEECIVFAHGILSVRVKLLFHREIEQCQIDKLTHFKTLEKTLEGESFETLFMLQLRMIFIFSFEAFAQS